MNDNDFLILVDELEGQFGDPDLRVVDCRFSLTDSGAGSRMYLDGHIPGAVFADLEKDLSGPIGPTTGRHPLPDAKPFRGTLGKLGIDGACDVVVYDDASGAVAARLWWLLRWMGHERVRLLDGGLAAWQRAGLDVEPGRVEVAGRRFTGTPRDELVIHAEELSQEVLLLDARAESRFRGEQEPIDAVAGHIPGSVNLPFTRNLDGESCWLPREAVTRHMAAALGEDRSRPWAVMCGSGVTACHLVIAGLVAGYSDPRVYVGSWSEWILDPRREIATG